MTRKEEGQMIKVSVFYPNEEGKKFDMGYYCNKHIPMVQQKLGAACKRVAVEQGLGGPEPGSRATYIAMGHLYFDSVEAFQICLRAPRGSDYGRYPQLHRHPAHDSDQRSENIVALALFATIRSPPDCSLRTCE